MNHIKRLLCAVLAVGLLGVPMAGANAAGELIVQNSTVTTEEHPIFVAKYTEDGVEQSQLTPSIRTISVAGSLSITAAGRTDVTVNILTNLNGDAFYEWVNPQEGGLALDVDGTLSDDGDVTSMRAGERRTLKVSDLFSAGYDCEYDRATNQLDLMDGLTPIRSGDIIYAVTISNASVTSSYYFKISPTIPASVPVSALGAGVFTDIQPWDDNWIDVDWAVKHEVLSGKSTTTFAPDDLLDRAQLVQILYAQAGRPTVSQPHSFTDVAATAWYSDAVAWASELGLVSGVGDGRFAPTDTIVRQQMSLILLGNAKRENLLTGHVVNLSSYVDRGEISSWAMEGISWAVACKILLPTAEGKLLPKAPVTRAEMAAALRVYDGL